MANETAATVDDYIAASVELSRDRQQEIRALIREIAPDAQESISYAIPAYKVSGKPLIYFAAYAKHIGIYPLPEDPSPALHAEMAPYVAGKGTLQFPHDKPLPLDLIGRVVASRLAHLEAKTDE